MPLNRCGFLAWIAIGFWPILAHAQWTVEKTEGGASIKSDGKLVAEYLTKSGTKPILWPIIGPTGKPVTRSFPMKNVPGETHDHPHQRSSWLSYGLVNGFDFWAETGTAPPAKLGTTEHKKFVTLAGGDQEAVVETLNDWLGPDGKPQCSDRRRLRFSKAGDQQIIDFDITLTAPDKPAVFGDTKEGAFGVRVAEAMALKSKLGGQIVNSRGQTDNDAWGQPAEWVDYHGPLDDEDEQVVGIAILNHPSSFHFPTRWHVRDYGLFAANPFGREEFPGGGEGGYTLEPGKDITLRYRMILHTGDEKEAKLKAAYDDYAKEARP